jgi:hypothetical protein
MLGLDPHAICVLLDFKTAFVDISIVVRLVQDLARCISAKEVAKIPALEWDGLVEFEGSAIFIPSPVFQNAILTSNTKNSSKLIPIILKEGRSFDVQEFQSNAVHHTYNLNAWLHGMKNRIGTQDMVLREPR